MEPRQKCDYTRSDEQVSSFPCWRLMQFYSDNLEIRSSQLPECKQSQNPSVFDPMLWRMGLAKKRFFPLKMAKKNT
jgi:hypothetical protein